jgi:DNA-binding MarR family transcriptional regulator
VSDDVLWLSPEEELTWIALIGVLVQLPSAIDAQLLRDSGLTFFEHGVLSSLSHAGTEDGLRMSDLATISSSHLPRLSQVITRMETRGWVRRVTDAADRRVIRVVLLPEGRRTLDDAAAAHVANVRRLVFDHLSATQVRQLRTIARQITSAMGSPSPLLEIRKEQLER